MYFFFPETAGRHLEEVDEIFRNSKNIFDPVKQARHFVPHRPFESEEAGSDSVSKEKVAMKYDEQ